ncbi:hypothetical protein C8Q74DRAFT_1362453 [Fomes fomentarius]|nr:hypothetical protein C8Q74DRAFT_1362453 [Fomes fomentarius]
MHQWAFGHFINAAVFLVPGGIERVMSATAPICMNITVSPIKVPYPNPGNAWVIERWALNPCDGLVKANPNIVALSGDACPRYPELEALMKKKNDPRYVGLLSVLFTVKGTIHVMLCPLPIYRTRDPELVRQPSTHDALLDFMRLCAQHTSRGLPLRRVDSPAFAVPGRVVKKSRREWGWTPLFDDWEGRRIDLDGRCTFKTKMGIPHLMDFVTSL